MIKPEVTKMSLNEEPEELRQVGTATCFQITVTGKLCTLQYAMEGVKADGQVFD